MEQRHATCNNASGEGSLQHAFISAKLFVHFPLAIRTLYETKTEKRNTKPKGQTYLGLSIKECCEDRRYVKSAVYLYSFFHFYIFCSSE